MAVTTYSRGKAFYRGGVSDREGDLGTMRSARLVLHGDEMLTFVTTQYADIVAAPGEGKVLLPHVASVNLHIAVPYTDVGVEGYLAIDTGEQDILMYEDGAAIQTMFTTAGDTILSLRGKSTGTVCDVFTGDLQGTFYNKPLSVFMVNFGTGRIMDDQNNAQPWTGGGAANELSVTVLYSIFEL